MNVRVFSYSIFFIALFVVGIFTIKSLVFPTPTVEKGVVKEAKMVEPLNIKKEIEEIRTVEVRDNSKIGGGDKKKETSNTILDGNKSKKIRVKFDENRTTPKPQQDSNQNQQDGNSSKDIMGVDPVSVKLHNIVDFNSTSTESNLPDLLTEIGAEMGDKVLIRIFKSTYLLEIWMEVDGVYKHLKSYPICTYSGELGPKLKEGDKQAPEGFYQIKKSSLNPNSKFHLSMNIGYPNKYDREHNRTGSYIMIHGACVSIGCFAMGDDQIEEIYEIVEAALNEGQESIQVQIFPFRMTQKELRKHSKSKWYDFWLNLKEGYDYFENSKTPPKVDVVDGNYTFR